MPPEGRSREDQEAQKPAPLLRSPWQGGKAIEVAGDTMTMKEMKRLHSRLQGIVEFGHVDPDEQEALCNAMKVLRNLSALDVRRV